MKILLTFFISIIFISCKNSVTSYEYPDGISQSAVSKESKGCGNIFVYQFLSNTQALTVWLNADKYELTQKRQEIIIDPLNENLSVVLEIAGNSNDSIYFNFCSDIGYQNEGVTTKYRAASGKLSFSVSEDNPIKEPIWETNYFVTVVVEDLHLVNEETKDEIIIDKIVFWNVNVGWLPG